MPPAQSRTIPQICLCLCYSFAGPSPFSSKHRNSLTELRLENCQEKASAEIQREFSEEISGWILRSSFWCFLLFFCPWTKRAGKSTAKLQSELGSFAAKIHTEGPGLEEFTRNKPTANPASWRPTKVFYEIMRVPVPRSRYETLLSPTMHLKVYPKFSHETEIQQKYQNYIKIADFCASIFVLFSYCGFTQISGRNFLHELCGEVHPQTAPLQALCRALRSTDQSTFWGGEESEKVPRKGEEEGCQQRGPKGKRRVKTGQSRGRTSLPPPPKKKTETNQALKELRMKVVTSASLITSIKIHACACTIVLFEIITAQIREHSFLFCSCEKIVVNIWGK